MILNKIIVFFCAIFIALSVQAQIPGTVVSAIKQGNSKELSKYMNNNVELFILEKENIYSQAQAELILREFFKVHPPVSFNILHEGGRNDSKYVIGRLKTTSNDYRLYMLIKTEGGNSLIHQLRIDEDNGN